MQKTLFSLLKMQIFFLIGKDILQINVYQIFASYNETVDIPLGFSLS